MLHAEAGAPANDGSVGNRGGPDSAISPPGTGLAFHTHGSAPSSSTAQGALTPLHRRAHSETHSCCLRSKANEYWGWNFHPDLSQLQSQELGDSGESWLQSWNPGSIPSGCVTSEKSLCFSEPMLPLVEKADNRMHPAGLLEDEMRRCPVLDTFCVPLFNLLILFPL